ncbi:hypothetical protein INR49_008585, partial [Caranx melampygus]
MRAREITNHNRPLSVVSTRLQLLTVSCLSAVLLLSSSRRHFKQLPVLCPVMEEEREQLCRQD